MPRSGNWLISRTRNTSQSSLSSSAGRHHSPLPFQTVLVSCVVVANAITQSIFIPTPFLRSLLTTKWKQILPYNASRGRRDGKHPTRYGRWQGCYLSVRSLLLHYIQLLTSVHQVRLWFLPSSARRNPGHCQVNSLHGRLRRNRTECWRNTKEHEFC